MSNTEGVILAAGYSSRTAQHKLKLRLGGDTLLEKCIAGISKVCDRIIVVGGFGYKTIKGIVDPLEKVDLVYNEDFSSGMFTSVKCGIRRVNTDRFFLIPGDQPLVKVITYQEMLRIDADIVIPRYKGKKGHPVLLKSALIQEILAMPNNGILRDFIHRKDSECIDVDDEGILLDVDTWEDFLHIKVYYNQMIDIKNHATPPMD